MKILSFFCALLCLAAVAAESTNEANERSNVTPKDGFVPNSDTAIKIAIAVWEPIYGADKIAIEKPYQARLTNGVWIVEGTLPKDIIGGVAEARIAKNDGRILKVSRGK
jgi:hypothetical protein